MKEKTTNKNCPYCRYNNITAFAVKYTTSDHPIEEYIPVNFCPKCGANLTRHLNDRLTYFLSKRRKMRRNTGGKKWIGPSLVRSAEETK